MYRDHLVENGYLNVKDWKCKFDYFDNGIKITNVMRKIFRKNLEKGIDFGNPFKISDSSTTD